MPAKKPAKKSANKKPAGKPATKMPPSRVRVLAEEELTDVQRALLDSIRSGPRGAGTTIRGPFAVFLHAPAFGELAQQLGGYCRFKTAVPPRLSEFAILTTAKLWRAQYEWHAHAPIAEKAGVKPKTIADVRAGRIPKGAPKDERAIYDFVKELYKTKRVGNRNYKRVQALLGDAATIELVGILGYYSMVAMSLNVFHMPLPDGVELYFKE